MLIGFILGHLPGQWTEMNTLKKTFWNRLISMQLSKVLLNINNDRKKQTFPLGTRSLPILLPWLSPWYNDQETRGENQCATSGKWKTLAIHRKFLILASFPNSLLQRRASIENSLHVYFYLFCCLLMCSCLHHGKMPELACWTDVEEGQRVAVNPVESALDLLSRKLTADAWANPDNH